MKMAPKNLPLSRFEKKVTEINGVVEEGLFEHVFATLGPSGPEPRFCVEIGAGDGTNHSFSRNLIERHGFSGLLLEADEDRSRALLEKFDGHPAVRAKRAFVSLGNILPMFEAAGVPSEFALLCIDIDGNDAHVWEAVGARYRPELVCVEYNASFGPRQEFTIPYREDFCWQGDDYFGASFATLVRLGQRLGYRLLHCTSNGDNLLFIRGDLAPRFALADPADPEAYFQLPQYGRNGRAPNGKGHPAAPQTPTPMERIWFKARYRLLAIPRKIVNLATPKAGEPRA